MPHLRKRWLLSRLKKKLGFSRIVSIQGARQTGKSVLARDLFDAGLYTTLDKSAVKNEAENRTGAFLESLQNQADGKTIVIDEAQKVPQLFDEIKAVVDFENRPGQFLLLGSTEFSLEMKIRESLTGRLSRTRLYPLTLTETLDDKRQTPIQSFWKVQKSTTKRKELLRFLERGGFPAIFSIRDNSEREDRLQEWLKLTCERDVQQIKKIKIDSDLCREIIEILPHLEEPTATSISKQLKRSTVKIQSQLNALFQIFAVHKLMPHALGTGKPHYYLIDPALGHALGAEFYSRLTIAIVTEFLAKESYQTIQGSCRFSYYRGRKGSLIPLLIEMGSHEIIAIKWNDSERVDLRELAVLKSFQEKAGSEKIKVIPVYLCGVHFKTTIDGVTVLPWEYVF